MKWHKVEDYPVGLDEYVLVSTNRTRAGCVVAKLVDGFWDDGFGVRISASPTDRWCHIELSEG